MKKALKLTLAVALVMSVSSLFAQKLGRVNTQEIILTMPETKEMQTNMEAYAKDLQDNIETIGVEFNNKLQEYQKNYETLSNAVREMKAKELEDLRARREQFEQAAQADYQRHYNELMEPIIEKARAAIEKVSAAGGYLVVFDISAGSMAYFDPAALTDVTPEVKAELGITDTPAAQ